MTITELNNKLKNGAVVTFSLNDVYGSDAFRVKVLSLAPNRTVMYGWTSLDGYPVEKTKLVSESTWDYIIAKLSDNPEDEES